MQLDWGKALPAPGSLPWSNKGCPSPGDSFWRFRAVVSLWCCMRLHPYSAQTVSHVLGSQWQEPFFQSQVVRGRQVVLEWQRQTDGREQPTDSDTFHIAPDGLYETLPGIGRGSFHPQPNCGRIGLLLLLPRGAEAQRDLGTCSKSHSLSVTTEGLAGSPDIGSRIHYSPLL